MYFVLILIAALTVYAQAAPQFNSFNSRDWRSTGAVRQDESQTNNGDHNRKIDVIRQDFISQSRFTGHRGSNDYGQQTHQNYQGSSDQCWDPVDQNYRDRPSHPQHTHHPDQFYNDNFPVQSNYNPSGYQYPYPEEHYHGPQPERLEPQPSPYRRERGPPQHNHHQYRPSPGPPHHQHRPPPQHHGYERPPHNHQYGPPPQHHGYERPPHNHQHGPPPQHHGYGYPPHYHQHGPLPLPSRPPHPTHNGNEYELEICEETTKESNVFDNPENSTSDNLDVVNIPSSLPVLGSSIKPEIITENTNGKLIESTTQFDWNNYFPEANRGSQDTDGIGIIDVRIGGIEPV